MDKFQIVTLSGVITDPRAGLNYIMSCFFFSKVSQTVLFKDSVISLPALIKKYGNDPIDMASAVESNLDTLLRRYFSMVSVEAEGVDDGANINLEIRGYVTTKDSTGDVRLDLGYILASREGSFRKIVDQLNDEVIYE